jgi:hypothetical protein
MLGGAARRSGWRVRCLTTATAQLKRRRVRAEPDLCGSTTARRCRPLPTLPRLRALWRLGHLAHYGRSGADATVSLHDDQAFDSRYVEPRRADFWAALLGRRRAGVARRRSQAAAVTAFAFGFPRPRHAPPGRGLGRLLIERVPEDEPLVEILASRSERALRRVPETRLDHGGSTSGIDQECQHPGGQILS